MALALMLVQLTGPDGQRVDVNPAEVVSVRAPFIESHHAEGANCLLNMADGRTLTVKEECDMVRARLGEAK